MRNSTTESSVTSYSVGFFLSLLLTLLPFYIVMNRSVDGWLMIFLLVFFAVAQLVVQLIFFLHLTSKNSRGWNIIAFLFMLLVVIIIVIGSLWIMKNLDRNMTMSPKETDATLLEKEAMPRQND